MKMRLLDEASAGALDRTAFSGHTDGRIGGAHPTKKDQASQPSRR